jgi:hypothetical protein
MFGKKKVDRLASATQAEVARAVEGLKEKERAIAQKDLYVVSAALASDQVLLSCDEAARHVFSRLKVARLRGLSWANPDDASGNVADWLRRGAPNDAAYALALTGEDDA